MHLNIFPASPARRRNPHFLGLARRGPAVRFWVWSLLLAIFARLRGQAQTGRGACVDDGMRSILSCSPELFFAVDNGVIAARPMKGTALGGADEQDDARILGPEGERQGSRRKSDDLDLIRNDIGRGGQDRAPARSTTYLRLKPIRPCIRGSRPCERNCATAERPAISCVRCFPVARLRARQNLRAVEIINELEKGHVESIAGESGIFASDGSTDFNAAIRTLTMGATRGGWISAVASSPIRKWTPNIGKCLIKARFSEEGRPPLSLIETLRYDLRALRVRRRLLGFASIGS